MCYGKILDKYSARENLLKAVKAMYEDSKACVRVNELGWGGRGLKEQTY